MPIYSYPDFDGGFTPRGSSSSGWDSFESSTYSILITPKTSRDINIISVTYVEMRSEGSSNTYEALIEFSKGRQGEEIVFLQFPFSYIGTSNTCYENSACISLPEPISIPKGTRLRVRIRTSELTGTTWNGIKFMYEADGPLLTYGSGFNMNNYLFAHGTGSGSECIR